MRRTKENAEMIKALKEDPCETCPYVGEEKDPDDLFERHCDWCENYKEE